MDKDIILEKFSLAGENFEDILALHDNETEIVGFVDYGHGRVLLTRENKYSPVQSWNDFLSPGDTFTLEVDSIKNTSGLFRSPFQRAWHYFKLGLQMKLGLKKFISVLVLLLLSSAIFAQLDTVGKKVFKFHPFDSNKPDSNEVYILQDKTKGKIIAYRKETDPEWILVDTIAAIKAILKTLGSAK